MAHPVTQNPEYCGASVQEETYLVQPGTQGIKNVVIQIEGIERGKKPSHSPLLIENKHCHFIPHLLVGMAGDTFEVRNSDPGLHNTHLHLEEASILNVAMPPGGRNVKRPLPAPGIVDIRCDARKFMQGWLVVTDNPYAAITDEEGNYKISGIPPGTYKVKIWHEGLPEEEKEVMISPGGKTRLNLSLGLK